MLLGLYEVTAGPTSRARTEKWIHDPLQYLSSEIVCAYNNYGIDALQLHSNSESACAG